ncbi:MAG: tRNA(Ile)(2)-agmatinylcytidine synthase [Candidatus Thermoplasmatota archaeon]
MWVGIDDTDAINGGCTTFIATEIIKDIISLGYDLIGYPRIVRLNPNILWKTRGNASIAIQFGIGGGKRKQIGEIDEKKIYIYERKKEEANEEEIIMAVDKIIREKSSEEANPAWVVSRKKFSRSLYRKAVKEIVSVEEVKKILMENGAKYRCYRGEIGLVGASSAISWKPFDRTYELLTYTNGKKYLDKESVIKMDKLFPSTFNNYDYENDYIAIFPKAKSPVFFGIRGENPEELKEAMKILISSPFERWLIFETNQATDEHLQKKRIEEIKPYESVIVRGKVKKEPFYIEGGHIIFSISNGGEIDCTAYEPTKNFRKLIEKLREGDEVVVYGGVREKPFTINIEKIEIKKVVEVYEKIENPFCENCKKHMKSIGKNKGYRCPKCGKRASEKDAKYIKIERPSPGLYEVPVVARRHLFKPLKRIK